jgi:hypothetical protein
VPFADQLDQTVERIIDEAIDFYMHTRGWYRAGGGSFHLITEPGWEMTPPGKPVRTSGGHITHNGMPTEWGFDYGSGTNAGSLVYAHFEHTIRDIFSWWHSIPTPADFDSYLDTLTDAAGYIALTSQGNQVAKTGNREITAVDFLQKKIGGDDMGGDMILTFDQNFCTPLPTVLHGQYAVILLVGVTLCGEKEIWAKAQQDILAIADKMLEAMKDRGAANDPVVDLGTIAALAGVGALFPGAAKPTFAAAGTVLSALDTLLKSGSPTKPTVEFVADTAEGVITRTQDALKKLAETIRGREDEIEGTIKRAMEEITSPGASFDMPKPKLLEETRIDGMKVDLHDLNFIAETTLPQIETQINKASDGVYYGSMCQDAWYRPTEIGASDTAYGPVDTWVALATLAKNLTADLAWEVKQSAEHLAIASERTGRTEAEIEASMRRHAEKIRGGSGYNPIGEATEWVNQNR